MGALATFDAQGAWGETHVCDGMLRQSLQPLGARWGRCDAAGAGPSAPWQPVPGDPPWQQVIQVVEGSLLIHLPHGSGHLGLLCEAGEWLALPPGLAWTLDAGAAPDLDLRAWPPSGQGLPRCAQAAGHAARNLPSHGDFIERMLELTGYAAEE
jgi:1,2-dihydroxy-3-keto-5-methylthiopentene dioxygenase